MTLHGNRSGLKGLVKKVGYYDQDYDHLRQNRRRGGKGSWFLAGLVGAILGALLVIFALPALTSSNLLPYTLTTDEEAENEDTTRNEDDPGVQKSVNVNVVSEVTKAVDKASEAVVGVVNLQQASFWSDEGQEAGTGSGVIYKKENGKAFIVTNHHVIEGATQLEVSLKDGTRVPAKLLGSDDLTDLAVIQIDAKHVKKIAQFGNSDNVRPGEPVIAIGNPLGLTFSGSVTQGIISGVDRTIPIDLDQDGNPDWQADVLQTDAAINPGNSGGALINIEGQVIGINSMKIAQQEVEGIGLAIPATIVEPIISDLEKYGEVRRPYIGVSLKSLNEIPGYHLQETLHLPESVKAGAAILRVAAGSPAAKAGLKEYDVIVALDGNEIKDVVSLRKYLYKKQIGDTMEATFYRDGKKQKVSVKLAEESY